MNSINVTARLVRNPEARETNGGTAVSAMRVAIDGPSKDKTVFIDLTAYGKLAKACNEHLTKGRQVAIAGRLEFEQWGEEGARKSRHSIVAEQVDFLAKPKADEA